MPEKLVKKADQEMEDDRDNQYENSNSIPICIHNCTQSFFNSNFELIFKII